MGFFTFLSFYFLSDFLAGLFHHAAHAILGVAAHAVNGVTRFLGDEGMSVGSADDSNLV